MVDYVSHAEQKKRLVRYIGDQVNETGEPIPHLPEIGDIIGAKSDSLAYKFLRN